MLITLLANQSGLLDLPLLHMSAYLERHKEEYIDKLYSVSAQGRWEDWISFFLAGVEASCREATAIVDRIIRLLADLRKRAQNTGKSPRLMMIMDALFGKSWTTVSEIQKQCRVTFPTAQADLRLLVQKGLLREMSGKVAKIYFAPEIPALSDRT